VNNQLIRRFNTKFLKINTPTDVLAFNSGNSKIKKAVAADIMISTDAALKQARSFKTTPDYELSLYVAHGLLHILGYNDQTPAQIKLMRKKENQYVDR
jgi:probable rRNA maturation factor